jgi:uncharacterized damage-inducible protein DinB
MDDLLETWHAQNAITLFLLASVPQKGLDAVPAGAGTAVGQMFAHINDVRLRWVHKTAPDLAEQLPWFEQQPDRAVDAAQLQQALARSGEAVAALIRRRAQAGAGIEGFPGSLTSFLGYLISHESYHWGEIGLALMQAGLPLGREVEYGIWRGWWGRESSAGDNHD